MAMNKIRGAFAVPRKGETFELRAGLVYAVFFPPRQGLLNGGSDADLYDRSQYAYERYAVMISSYLEVMRDGRTWC